MKVQIAELISGDLFENTLTLEVDGEALIKAGRYAIVPIEQYQSDEMGIEPKLIVNLKGELSPSAINRLKAFFQAKDIKHPNLKHLLSMTEGDLHDFRLVRGAGVKTIEEISNFIKSNK